MQFIIPESISNFILHKSCNDNFKTIHIFKDCVRITNTRILLKVHCENDIGDMKLAIPYQTLKEIKKELKIKGDMVCKIIHIDDDRQTIQLEIHNTIYTLSFEESRINFTRVEQIENKATYIFKDCDKSLIEASQLQGVKILEYENLQGQEHLALRIGLQEILKYQFTNTSTTTRKEQEKEWQFAYQFNLLQHGLELENFDLYIESHNTPALIQQGNKKIILMPKIL